MAEHPITPPPELVEEWCTDFFGYKSELNQSERYIATHAARWGADQELEACINEIHKGVGLRHIDYSSNRESLCSDLRAARRPKPTLKQQALEGLRSIECNFPQSQRAFEESCELIRSALESLPD